MALTHDGLQTPLAPNRLWQLIGVAVLVGGIAWCVSARGAWLCPAISVIVVGLLMVGNQVRGITRVRVTFSKLLVENERPVMGFLIGPSKERIPWEELDTVEVVGGRVVAKGKPNAKGATTVLELGGGSPEAELQDLARKIKDAAERFEIESQDQKPS